jgi:hypothetical protein
MRSKSVSTVLFALLLIGSSATLLADGFPERCAGTYLNQEGSGAKSIWTLGEDGSFLGTSSTQKVFNFSDQQGVWENDGSGGAKGVFLDFSFDASGALLNIGRVDIVFHTVGSGCAKIAGSFTLRFFPPGEDPLDLSSFTGTPITDTFTGRRLTVAH